MKATNEVKQIHVVTIEIDDLAEVAALRTELNRYSNTTGGPDLQAMAKLARVVLDAISPQPTYRDVAARPHNPGPGGPGRGF